MMTFIQPILAQSSFGDMSDWTLLVMFCLWPFHIVSAVTGPTFSQLRGYGIFALAFQILGLVFLFASFVFVLRSSKMHRLAKILYLLIGYPMMILVTNFGPSLTFR
jgi:hypothetical protein